MRNRIVIIALVVGFLGILAWSTMRAQRAECTVCVEFEGSRNCASASAEDEAEAIRSAQTTACGPLARGMNESIACGNRPPVSRSCQLR